MRIEGRSSAEICDELGITQRTLYIWFSDPLVKEELASLQAGFSEQLREKINQGVLTAIEALTRMAAAPVEEPVSPAAKFQAARELLARVPLQNDAEVAQESSGAARVTSLMSKMNPQERREFSARAARKLLEMDGHRVIEAGSEPKPGHEN